MLMQQSEYYTIFFHNNILIVGLIPPPYGGIAIHINRVAQILTQQNNIIEIVDTVKESKSRSKFNYCHFLIKKLYTFRPQVIQYHTLFLRSNLVELVVLVVYKTVFRAQLVLIEHSNRSLYKRSATYKYFLNKLMYFIDQQVLIGQPMLQAYRDNNILLKPNFSIESPFLPPQLEQREKILTHYPQEVFNFLNKFDTTLLMNASKFGLWDGKDIYGFDLCIKIMHDLAYKNVGMVMAVGTIYDQQQYDCIKKQIDQAHNILLLTDLEAELWPMIELVDLVVRPSRFDTYGISVAEAIWLKKPVIASDVCPRPSGTILFKTGNYEDFKRVILVWMEYFDKLPASLCELPVSLKNELCRTGRRTRQHKRNKP